MYDLYLSTEANQTAIKAQENVLKEIAQKGACVIVGRAADFVLKDYNPFKVFIYAPYDKSSRPEIVNKNLDTSQYGVIFLGFPIWWYVAPTIINTFLESFDFSGKTIILFATSGGSGFGQAVKFLQPSAPKATIKEGKLLNGNPSEAQLRAWLNGIKV